MNYLVASIILGVVYIVFQAGAATLQRGLPANVGPRDSATPLTGVAGRLDRALRNFLETFPLYIGALVAVGLTGKQSANIELGSAIYFWARVLYLPIYAFGIPYLRTLVWIASIVGIALILYAVVN